MTGLPFEIRHGSFQYPGSDQMVVRDVDVLIEAGQLLAILGPNGAGKTTLLRTMIGLEKWTQGASYIGGRDISSMDSRELGRLLAYVPQARNAASVALSGLDMVMIGRAPHMGVFTQPGDNERHLALKTLESIGAADLAHMPCWTMSGGQFQMVLIARALVAEPRVLVLDEPETGLDFHNQLVVLDLLDRLVREEGLTVIMNTHYPAHALRVADQVLMIGRDHRPRYGKAGSSITEAGLRDIFDVDVAVGKMPYEDTEVTAIVPIRPRFRT